MYPNKRATGKAVSKGRRLRHRGVTYRVTLGQIWREDNGAYVGPNYDRDPRTSIDEILAGPREPMLRRTPKSRQFGRILSSVEMRPDWRRMRYR